MSDSCKSFHLALQAFKSSASAFRILRTLSQRGFQAPTTRLCILDSSFNPPTRAHHHIIRTALRRNPGGAPSRVLLLLATQNADKAASHAAFEQRLDMMLAFAQDLVEDSFTGDCVEDVAVDIGVTKLPYFVDKSKAIAAADEYQDRASQGPIDQTHLVGYDTLVRILDPKYYPPEHTLESLKGLFERHTLRVMLRDDEHLGSRDAQRDFIYQLWSGSTSLPGWRMEWAKQLEIDEATGGEAAMSSTRAREAAALRDVKSLEALCTKRVVQYLQDTQPYLHPA